MDLIFGIILIVVTYLVFSKGSEIYKNKKLIYEGSKKIILINFLNEYLSDFQKEPSAIHLDKSTASLTYTVGKRNYELTISVKLPPTRTSHYLISYKISDPKLAWWKYDMLEHYYLNPNENFENFQTNVQKEFTVKKQDISETIHSITNLLFEKSDIIMENQLGASYKRMNK